MSDFTLESRNRIVVAEVEEGRSEKFLYMVITEFMMVGVMLMMDSTSSGIL